MTYTQSQQFVGIIETPSKELNAVLSNIAINIGNLESLRNRLRTSVNNLATESKTPANPQKQTDPHSQTTFIGSLRIVDQRLTDELNEIGNLLNFLETLI
jgi:hypothetical protein